MAKAIYIICVIILTACSQQVEEKQSVELRLDNDMAKLGYAIGMDVAANLKQYGNDLDRAAVLQAISDQLDGSEPELNEKDATDLKEAYVKKKRAEIAAKNRAEGERFLAKHAKKEGVTVTASGLQYEIIKQGDGMKPKATDKVTVHYIGTLIDGAKFNPTHKFDQPTTFSLDRVIKGWAEGIQLMRVGSIFRFVIPSELAFGDQNRGATIGANSVLIFKVELLSIE